MALETFVVNANAKIIDKDNAILESLLSFKRAGCDGVLTYFATDLAKLLKK